MTTHNYAFFQPAQNPQAAIVLALDVLDHLNPGRLDQCKPAFGAGYLSCKGRPFGVLQSLEEEQLAAECHVCALGACMLSYLRLRNRLDELRLHYARLAGSEFFVLYWLSDNMKDELSTVFGRFQVALIETAYEGIPRDIAHAFDNVLLHNAMTFGYKHQTPNARLRAIMTNIIDNDGTFIP